MLSLGSKVEKVTVYRAGASVTRVAWLECPADGWPSQVRLVGLPLTLKDSSLRVRVSFPEGGGGLLATDLQLDLDWEAPARAAEEPVDEAAVRELRKQIRRAKLQLELLQKELSWLESLHAPNPAWEEPRPYPLKARRGLVEMRQRKLARSYQRREQLESELRELQQQLPENKPRETAGPPETAPIFKAVVLNLRPQAEGHCAKIGLHLSYEVEGARWAPSYSLRFDRDFTMAALEMRALICQSSGESWTGVQLEVSTSEIASWKELPELMSRHIGRRQAPPLKVGYRPPPPNTHLLFADFDRGPSPLRAEPVGAEEAAVPAPEADFFASLESSDPFSASERLDDDMLEGSPPDPFASFQAAADPFGAATTDPINRVDPFAASPADPFAAAADPFAASPADPFAAASDPFAAADPFGAASADPFAAAADPFGAPASEAVGSSAPRPALRRAPALRSEAMLESFASAPARKAAYSEKPVMSRSRTQSAPAQLGVGGGGGSMPRTPPRPGTGLNPDYRSDPFIGELSEEHLSYGLLYMPSASEAGRGRLKPQHPLEACLQLWRQRYPDSPVHPRPLIDSALRSGKQALYQSAPAGHELVGSVGGFDFLYPGECPIDLPGDAQFHSVPLLHRQLEAQLTWIVVPRVVQDVFRQARVESLPDLALPAGPVDVYVGTDYLATSRLAPVSPGESFTIGLGVEQAIKVVRNTNYRESTSGMMGGTLLLHHEIVVEVANQFGREVCLEIRERIPLPQDEKSEVKVRVDSSEPAWEPLRDSKFVHRWSLRVPAGEQRKAQLAYTVEIPSKLEIVGGNRREA